MTKKPSKKPNVKDKYSPLTAKQLHFVEEFIKTGNATEAAVRAYEAVSRVTAGLVGCKNLKKPHVRARIEAECSAALDDQIKIREELQKSKRDYAVRAGVNKDILDRGGYKAKDIIEHEGELQITWKKS